MDILWPLVDPDRVRAEPIEALVAVQLLRPILISTEAVAVVEARRSGRGWAEVGEALGVSKQAAQQRFGLLCELSANARTVAPRAQAVAEAAKPAPAKPGRQQPKSRRRR